VTAKGPSPARACATRPKFHATAWRKATPSGTGACGTGGRPNDAQCGPIDAGRIDAAAAFVYKQLVALLRRAAERTSYALGAFIVAALPQALKREGRLAGYLSPAAHVASAICESVVCAVLFFAGMIPYVANFGRSAGWTYLTHQPILGSGDFLGVGALAYLSYLVRPQALLLLFCLVEGIVRAIEVVYSDRLAGLGIVWLTWQAVRVIRRQSRTAKLALLLGPARPDEVLLPAQSRHRMLEIYSIENKPWSEQQVLAIDDAFFQLASRRLVRHGTHHAYQYLFHELETREVIRGTIVRYALPPAPRRDDPTQPRAAASPAVTDATPR
jgi:hypothetical protein